MTCSLNTSILEQMNCFCPGPEGRALLSAFSGLRCLVMDSSLASQVYCHTDGEEVHLQVEQAKENPRTLIT